MRSQPKEAALSQLKHKQTVNQRNRRIMLTKLNRKHAGFTLVEIMIVVAIIALLAAIAGSWIPARAQTLSGFQDP